MLSNEKKTMTLEIDITEMTPAQMRMIKTLNKMIEHVATTDNEAEFFDGGAECIRLCAALIKQSRFISDVSSSSIPYERQVLEYSIDILQENIDNAKVVTYDN